MFRVEQVDKLALLRRRETFNVDVMKDRCKEHTLVEKDNRCSPLKQIQRPFFHRHGKPNVDVQSSRLIYPKLNAVGLQCLQNRFDLQLPVLWRRNFEYSRDDLYAGSRSIQGLPEIRFNGLVVLYYPFCDVLLTQNE